jgi:cytochrome b pre-mRNA-processing protein 3
MRRNFRTWLNRTLRGEGDSVRAGAVAAYRRAILQARDPLLFTEYGVADTVDGRFDMIVLHVFLLMHRLREDMSEPARAHVQAIFDIMLDDLDQNVRQLGAQDIGVGKRVKAMAEAFNGRVHAYDAALNEGGDALEQALARNVYGQDVADARARRLAGYVRRNIDALAEQSEVTLLRGAPQFSASGGVPA